MHIQKISLLDQALSSQDINTLSADLINMFVDKSLDKSDDLKPAIERFHLSREIYNGLRHQPPDEIIFYRREFLSNSFIVIGQEWHNLKEACKSSEVKGESVEDRLIQFFEHRLDELLRLPQKTEGEEAQLRLCRFYFKKINVPQYWATVLQDPNLPSDLRQKLFNQDLIENIEGWFEFEDNFNLIPNFESIFFGVKDVDEARRTYKVYDPAERDEDNIEIRNIHNWGTNCAFVLGLIHNRVNVRIASPVTAEHRARSNPYQTATIQPSAFALEIVTALTAGYTLNYNGATKQITLAAPKKVSLIFDDNMTGIEGQLLLQTRDNQLALYDLVAQQVADAEAQHIDIVNWVPPILIKHASLERLSAYVENQNTHLVTLCHIIKNPITTPQILLSIINHPNTAFEFELLEIMKTVIINKPHLSDELLEVLKQIDLKLDNEALENKIFTIIGDINSFPKDTDLYPFLNEIVDKANNEEIKILERFSGKLNESDGQSMQTVKQMLKLLILEKVESTKPPHLKKLRH